jgi:hypothetical protein
MPVIIEKRLDHEIESHDLVQMVEHVYMGKTFQVLQSFTVFREDFDRSLNIVGANRLNGHPFDFSERGLEKSDWGVGDFQGSSLLVFIFLCLKQYSRTNKQGIDMKNLNNEK